MAQRPVSRMLRVKPSAGRWTRLSPAWTKSEELRGRTKQLSASRLEPRRRPGADPTGTYVTAADPADRPGNGNGTIWTVAFLINHRRGKRCAATRLTA
jgi:hypothetical protein